MHKSCTLHAHTAHTAHTDSTGCTHPPMHTARTLQAKVVHLLAIRMTTTYFAQTGYWLVVDWLSAIYFALFLENRNLCSQAGGRQISGFRL